MHLTPHGPRPGFQFLQIPGPTNVPGEILGAIAQPTIDHRGPEFRALAEDVHAGLRSVFRTEGPVVVYPSSGTGAWEAALTNTLSPGDRVLMFENGEWQPLRPYSPALPIQRPYGISEFHCGPEIAFGHELATALRLNGLSKPSGTPKRKFRARRW